MPSIGNVRRVAAVVGPAAIGIAALVGSAGTANAEETPAAPGILEIELDLADGGPTAEVEFVDLEGAHREIQVDLQTGQIVEEEPEDD
ncbi:PepSY domain-containing protein [Rhodococcus spongiicola]|uniref:Peptidase n=1 Tax=Rhodococcus spongiicola TaxID=2487352 RepID=A0A438APF6_9NOCA|nr:peptidase [Rhodococcus spongiicola]RVW00519.1 peptidase [Rhodococcus spongiicola]